MFLFSTIIYFGENPVGYDLHRKENYFRFIPTVHRQVIPDAPILTVTYSRGLFFIEGTQENEIKEQVMKIIDLNKQVATLHVAS